GGNPDGGTHVQWDKDPEEEMRLEIFSPPYLFRGPRPTITAAPPQCTYGQTVQIGSPESANIHWASLIRNGVTTHSFDTSQRLVDLEIVNRSAGILKGKVPANRNIAPPGWYMLFLVDNHGIPSEARWILLN